MLLVMRLPEMEGAFFVAAYNYACLHNGFETDLAS